MDAGLKIIQDLADKGVEKINFVGGEPMLHPHLNDWIIESKRVGMTTSIVSNGTNMTKQWLNLCAHTLTGWGCQWTLLMMKFASWGEINAREFKEGASGHLQRV